MVEPRIALVPLADIVIDAALQPRASLDEERVAEYAEHMFAGIEFPPVRVFRITDRDERLYLTSGFHRRAAAAAAEFESIVCEVLSGTYAEAKWDAAGSNKEWDSVGARRTNADKKRAARLAWEARPHAPQRTIADQVGVHQTSIGNWIKEWESRRDDNHHGFNKTNEMVDWARWTWNPVTGCEHTCVYCYARDIAHRYPQAFPKGFRPDFHKDRLDAPRHTVLPEAAARATDPIERTAWRNVFVGSMADLFGRWVPDKWIDAVFGSCRASPQWNYLFLTKFPQRYTELNFPPTSWVGTSVDEQKRVAAAEKAFSKIEVPVKWLSVEPMLEPIEFTDLRMFDWVVIGGQSRSSGAPEFFPEAYWVNRLIDRAHEAGCRVYCKPNTDPAWHWSGLFQEYPEAFTRGRHDDNG